MKHASLIAAAVLVLLANAFALVHASRNRSGTADAEIILTDRELSYFGDPDDSGVALNLRWVSSNDLGYSRVAASPETKPLLDRAKLAELGFDCSVDPSDKNAYAFYSRQSARTAFVALEYDGPAWRSWLDREQWNQYPGQTDSQRQAAFSVQQHDSSRLAVLDAALDPAVLRTRHPDRSRVVIVPTVINVSVLGPAAPGKVSYLSGYFREIPSVIHVPQPFSDKFREPDRKLVRAANSEEPVYRVRLRYGALLEPWVVGVEFLK